ncbi:hypothetical protein KIF24_10160 [Micromonospora sp. Llam7]|uniref:hypothetical protein n=1 Tax=Micromonospora tarapacensis TaxID=2835305 RepID=UPI001C82C71E|nr:hypothetical protein [Micromonospora tarapacensis]MBX7266354.1 hypothetical protein [Micromonospora tarapacensis]
MLLLEHDKVRQPLVAAVTLHPDTRPCPTCEQVTQLVFPRLNERYANHNRLTTQNHPKLLSAVAVLGRLGAVMGHRDSGDPDGVADGGHVVVAIQGDRLGTGEGVHTGFLAALGRPRPR